MTVLVLLQVLVATAGASEAMLSVELVAPSATLLAALRDKPLSVEAVTPSPLGFLVSAVVRRDDVAALRAAGYHVTPTERPDNATRQSVAALDSNSVETWVRDFTERHPQWRHETLGYSVEGRPISALRRRPEGSQPGGPETAPALRIIGGHHGDELPGVSAPLAIIEDWTAEEEVNPGFAATLAALHIVVIPLMNPDGLDRRSRYNARGVDLNRNYPVGFNPREFASGQGALSEPETRAIAADSELHRYAASLSFHAGAFNIGYPLNMSVAALPSDALLSMYADLYTEEIAAAPDGETFYATRGGQWYLSYGDLNDYAYTMFGTADLTVEASRNKRPAATDAFDDLQLPAARRFLETLAQTRVVRVFDAVTGAPLPARVATTALTAVAEPRFGVAQLLAPDGALSISCPGYAEVAVTAPAGAPVAVALEPLAQGPLIARADPFEQQAAAPLAFRLPLAPGVELTSARLVRPGSDDLPLECTATGACDASPRDPRPGYWGIVAETSGGTAALTNALFIAGEPASAAEVSLDGDSVRVRGVTAAWLAERGGGNVAVDPTGEPVTLPGGSGGVDLAWQHEGRVGRLALRDGDPPFGGLTPPPPEPSHGCRAASADGISICALSLMGLAFAARRRRR